MLVICGKSASGKDTVIKEMTKRGWRRVVTWTTRPRRLGEVDNVDYHFVTDDEFDLLIRHNYFVECKKYKTTDGSVWRYGSHIDNEGDNAVIVLTPAGYRDLPDKIKKLCCCIYLYANDDTIKKRLRRRGDNKDEVARRIVADRNDFRGFENECDKIVYNNKDDKPGDVADRIIRMVRSLNK